MSKNIFQPKLFAVIAEGYTLKKFLGDLTAGILVGIVALPLAIAFAIASGTTPQQGLYTAIIAGFLISFFSGSRVQIGGPTGAFIVIVYGIVSQYGYNGLAVATLIAGILLLVMGFARMGEIIKFIPYPVTIGFTSGIALIIFTSQINDMFGLKITKLPAEFLEKITVYAHNLNSINLYSLFICLITLTIIILWPKITKRIPGSIIAIIATTLLVKYFNLPVETISNRFGQIPHTFPMPKLPYIDIHLIREMFSPAITIALLAGIESLLSAVVADGMTGRRHRSNTELIAQGIANIVSPIFGGIPATGAIARTATNIKNGGSTPFAGIIHAITLLIIMLFCANLAGLIPMATLAGILISVAYNMSEWQTFIQLFRGPKSDVAVLLITFLLTVLVDLTVAIEAGVIMAAFLFMRRMTNVIDISAVTSTSKNDEDDPETETAAWRKNIPKDVEVFEINGPFFFGVAEKFKDTILQTRRTPKVLILQMQQVPTIDATGINALEDVFEKEIKLGAILILSGVKRKPYKLLLKSGLAQRIGRDNIVLNIEQALQRANNILTKP